jgi:hypothetical protein
MVKRATPEIVWKTWLLLGFLEGLAAFRQMLQIASMPGKTWLFGYTAGRLALAGVVGLVLLGLGILTLSAFSNHRFFQSSSASLQRFINNDRSFTRLAVVLGYLLVLTTGILLVSQVSLSRLVPDGMTNLDAARALSLWQALYQRGDSILLWVCLLAGQGLAGLLLIRPGAGKAVMGQMGAGLDALLLLLIFTLLTFYWLLLVLGLNLFSLLPGWHWELRRAQVIRPWLAGFLPLLVMLAAALALRLYRRPKVALLLLLLAGTTYQFSFALFSSAGLSSISEPFAESWHAVYAQQAVLDRPIPEIIRSYESDYADPYFFMMTKPPGVIVFYAWMDRLIGWIHPVDGEAARLNSLLHFISLVYPFLAMLPVLLLYWLGRLLDVKQEHALLAPIFYICMPNVILMQLFLDQALYPLLFLGGILLAVQLCLKSSEWLALGLGAYLFLAFFFSFSLLVLLPFLFILFVFFLLSHWSKPRLLETLKISLLILAGMVLAFLVFRILFGYDFFSRLQNAMSSHSADSYGVRLNGQPAPAGKGLANFTAASVINNIEMGMWIGVPLFLIFLWEGVRAVWEFLHQRAGRAGLFSAAAFVTYLALNLQGGTYGEVGRLWIFLAPLFALAAAFKAPRLFTREQAGVWLVLLLQLTTISLIFLFQGYNP